MRRLFSDHVHHKVPKSVQPHSHHKALISCFPNVDKEKEKGTVVSGESGPQRDDNSRIVLTDSNGLNCLDSITFIPNAESDKRLYFITSGPHLLLIELPHNSTTKPDMGVIHETNILARHPSLHKNLDQKQDGQEQEEDITGIAVSPDGKLTVTTCRGGYLAVWKTTSLISQESPNVLTEVKLKKLLVGSRHQTSSVSIVPTELKESKPEIEEYINKVIFLSNDEFIIGSRKSMLICQLKKSQSSEGNLLPPPKYSHGIEVLDSVTKRVSIKNTTANIEQKLIAIGLSDGNIIIYQFLNKKFSENKTEKQDKQNIKSGDHKHYLQSSDHKQHIQSDDNKRKLDPNKLIKKLVEIKTFDAAHEGPLLSLQFSEVHQERNGTAKILLISSAEDRILKIWRGIAERTNEKSNSIFSRAISKCTSDSQENVPLSFEFDCLFHSSGELSGDIKGIAFHPKKQQFVTWSNDYAIRFWSTSNFQLVSQIDDAHSSEIRDIEFTQNGNALISVSTDGTFRIWSTTQYTKIFHHFSVSPSYISVLTSVSINWSKSDSYKLFISASLSRHLILWAVCEAHEHPAENLGQIQCKSSQIIWGVDYSPESNMVVAVSSDKDLPIQFFELRSNNTAPNKGSFTFTEWNYKLKDSVTYQACKFLKKNIMGYNLVTAGKFFETESDKSKKIISTYPLITLWKYDKKEKDGYTPNHIKVDDNPLLVIDSIAVSDCEDLIIAGFNTGRISIWWDLNALFHEGFPLTAEKFKTNQIDFGPHSQDYHEANVRSIRITSYDKQTKKLSFLSCGNDKKALIWDVVLDHNAKHQIPSKLFHRGVVSSIEYHKDVIFTASDCDGIKGWVKMDDKWKQELNSDHSSGFKQEQRHIFEIEEPCSALSIDKISGRIFSAHGTHVIPWSFDSLSTINQEIQPVSGKFHPMSSVSILPLPHKTSKLFGANDSNRASEQKYHEPIIHLVVAQSNSNDYVNELQQAFDTIPWVCGLYMHKIAELSSSQTPTPENMRILKHAAAALHKNSVLFLSPDPSCNWDFKRDKEHQRTNDNQNNSILGVLRRHSMSDDQEKPQHSHSHSHKGHGHSHQHVDSQNNSDSHLVDKHGNDNDYDSFEDNVTDALIIALENKNYQLVEFFLFELVQPLWKKTSLAFIFTSKHLTWLITHFPELVVPFIKPGGELGETELTIEKVPASVMYDCDQGPKIKPLLAGSLGATPHRFWQEHFTEQNTDANESTPRLILRAIKAVIQELDFSTLFSQKSQKGINRRSSSQKFIEGYTIAVKGILEHSRSVLNAADKVSTHAIKQEIYSLRTMDCLIRYEVHQNHAQESFIRNLIIHGIFVGMVVSFAFLVTVQTISARNQISAIGTGILAFLMASYFCFLMSKQVYDVGFWDFINQPWNFIDFFQVTLTYLLLALSLADSEYRHPVAAITVIFVWFKLIFYFRMFRSFAFLVRAIIQILSNVKAFLVIVLVVMFGFANAFYLVYHPFKQVTDWRAYQPGTDFESASESLLSVVSLMFGGFDYRIFLDAEVDVDIISSGLFCLYMFITAVILLNVMIAIANDSFANVTGTKNIHFRAERAAMVVEYTRGNKKKKMKKGKFWIQVLSISKDIVDLRTWSEPEVVISPIELFKREVKERTEYLKKEIKALQEPVELLQKELQELKEKRGDFTPLTARGEVLKEETPDFGHSKRTILPECTDEEIKAHLEQLSNFALITTQVRLSTRSVSARVYEVDDMLNDRFLKHLEDIGLLNTGLFSKTAPLQPPGTTRNSTGLNIPAKATKFAVAFPLNGVGHLDHDHKDDLSMLDGSFTFLLFGGIIYFDDNDDILLAQAFSPGGKDIVFNKRTQWKPAYNFQIHKNRRFHPITIRFLKGQGAELFTWIAPGEILESDDGLFEWSGEFPYGAFVYLFHKDILTKDQNIAKFDCFFAVNKDCRFARAILTLPSSDASIKSSNERLKPIVYRYT